MFLIYSKPNHFSDATGDKLDRYFICKVEKKHQSSKMCRRQTADFLKKRMPRIAGLIACEWVERSFDHGEGLLRFFFFLRKREELSLTKEGQRPHPVGPELIPLNLLPLSPSLLHCHCGMRETLLVVMAEKEKKKEKEMTTA